MRCMKTLGLMVLAMAMAMALAGGAGASMLTQAPPYTGTVKAESMGAISNDGSIAISCQKSALEWSVEEHGASGATSGPLTGLTFEQCGNDTVNVLDRGHFELHATSGGNGTMTWTGAEITVQIHRVVFVPVTIHCIWKPNNTKVGTFTGSATTKGTAKLDIDEQIPEAATDSSCKNDTVLTGTYTFTSPDYLVVE